MGYNLLINGVYWGYNPLTNLLLTSWDILVETVLCAQQLSNFLCQKTCFSGKWLLQLELPVDVTCGDFQNKQAKHIPLLPSLTWLTSQKTNGFCINKNLQGPLPFLAWLKYGWSINFWPAGILSSRRIAKNITSQIEKLYKIIIVPYYVVLQSVF